MDMYGQNPFGYRRPNLSTGLMSQTSGVADFSDLDVVAHYLDKYLARDGRDQKLRSSSRSTFCRPIATTNSITG